MRTVVVEGANPKSPPCGTAVNAATRCPSAASLRSPRTCSDREGPPPPCQAAARHHPSTPEPCAGAHSSRACLASWLAAQLQLPMPVRPGGAFCPLSLLFLCDRAPGAGCCDAAVGCRPGNDAASGVVLRASRRSAAAARSMVTTIAGVAAGWSHARSRPKVRQPDPSAGMTAFVLRPQQPCGCHHRHSCHHMCMLAVS